MQFKNYSYYFNEVTKQHIVKFDNITGSLLEANSWTDDNISNPVEWPWPNMVMFSDYDDMLKFVLKFYGQ